MPCRPSARNCNSSAPSPALGLRGRHALCFVFIGLLSCTGEYARPVVAPTPQPLVVVAPDQPKPAPATAPDLPAPSTDWLTLEARELWRVGTGLSAPLALGPGSSIHATSRQGNLDVLEANGQLRFTVGLGSAARAPIDVRRNGATYVATVGEQVVGISPEGARVFAYRHPSGVRSGVVFAEGLGLLFRGRGNALLGINRAGFPTFRYDSKIPISLGPWAIGGRCVAITESGELIAVSRFGNRRSRLVGHNAVAVESTRGDAIWILSQSKLTAHDDAFAVRFDLTNIAAMTTVKAAKTVALAATSNVEGVVLDHAGTLRWLDVSGQTLAQATLPDAAFAARLDLTLTADTRTAWLVTREGDVLRVPAQGLPAKGHFEGLLGPPLLDPDQQRVLFGTHDGKVLAVPDGSEQGS